VNKENASRLWKTIQEAGLYLQDKLPESSNHPKGRNPYAHVALCVKDKFGLSYKDIPDEDFNNVKEYIDFLKEVLTWCQQNIKLGKDRKIRPRIDISFSQKGNVLGYYQYNIKKIMMYVLKNRTLRANAQVFIHEYVHHLQIRGKNDNIRYNNLTRRNSIFRKRS